MLTLNKTKAALQSCQCQNTKHPQNSTLIDQVNYGNFPYLKTGYTRSFVTHYLGIAGGRVSDMSLSLAEALKSASEEIQHVNRLNFEEVDLTQFFDSMSRSFFCFALHRFVASFRIATKINFEGVSPSCLTCSTKSITSCGTRKVNERDLEFTGPVGISAPPLNWCKTIYTKKSFEEDLKCKTLDASFVLHLVMNKVRLTKLGSAPTHTEPLTTTVSESNEAAMKDHITHPQGRNNYTWRFLAVSKSYPNTQAIAVYTNAPTEAEARSQIQGCVLYFAARLPVQEVRHA